MEIAKKDRVYLAGHNGLVGSALLKKLKEKGYRNALVKTSAELDLRNQEEVYSFFAQEKPTIVLLAAARVGGIKENETHPADFMTDNLLIAVNTIRASFENGVKKLIFIGSSSIYPSSISSPSEEDLFKGPPDRSNEGYSMAKLFGIKLCEMYHKQHGVNYFSVIPCNLYGKNDRFTGNSAHVIPALIRKFHHAKHNSEPYVTVWGSGMAMREFLYADDLADCCVSLLETDTWIGPCINIGSGDYLTIGELAHLVKKVVGYTGEIIFEKNHPEGQMLRKMDTSKLDAFGWEAKKTIEDGLQETYRFYLENLNSMR